MLNMTKLAWSILTSVKGRNPLASEVSLCPSQILISFLAAFKLSRSLACFFSLVNTNNLKQFKGILGVSC